MYKYSDNITGFTGEIAATKDRTLLFNKVCKQKRFGSPNETVQRI